MKAKNKIITGLVAAASFLALAGASYGAAAYCPLGKVVSTGSGYYPGSGTTIYTQRVVSLACQTDVGWGIDTGRVFTVPTTTTPPSDRDGVYAAALTALADDKKVAFYVSNTTERSNIRTIMVLDQSLP